MLKRTLIYLIGILTLFSNLAYSEPKKLKNKKKQEREFLDFQLYGDLKSSPFVGAHLMLSLGEGYEALLPHKNKGKNVGSALVRVGHSLLDTIFYFHTALVQHEAFGHGGRLREFGATNISYNFRLFSGSASGNYSRTTQKNLIFSAGGIEASDVMAQVLDLDYLDLTKIKTHKAWAYLFSFGNQGFYVHMFQDLDYPGHDIVSYIDDINNYAGSNGAKTNISEIRLYGLFDYLNPYLYYSLYGIGRYIATGENSFKYPMISITKNLSYLPATRLVLAPYGPELHILNYLRFKKYSGKLNLGLRTTEAASAVTLNAHVNPVSILPWLSLGLHAGFWWQPEINLGDTYSNEQNIGFLINLKPSFKMIENFYLNTHLGFKTRGFIQGESIASNPILRLGLRFTL